MHCQVRNRAQAWRRVGGQRERISRSRTKVQLIPVQVTIAISINANSPAGAPRHDCIGLFVSNSRQGAQGRRRINICLPVGKKITGGPVEKPTPGQAILESLGDEVHAAGAGIGQRNHAVEQRNLGGILNGQLPAHCGRCVETRHARRTILIRQGARNQIRAGE